MNISQSISDTLRFYELFGHPLTSVEIYKYLVATKQSPDMGLFDIINNIPENISSKNGFYFLNSQSNLVSQRLEKQKISALKWKKLKKICRLLQIIPFIKAIGVSGSMTLFSAKKESDFDLIIITQFNKIWTVRMLVSLFLTIIGSKRQGTSIQDKICLNCFITEKSMAVNPEIEPRALYLAQEYARIIPIFENEKGIWQKFKQENSWIKDFMPAYPWFEPEWHKIVPPFEKFILRVVEGGGIRGIYSFIRKSSEFLLNNPFGNWLERIFKSQQIARIKKNLTNHPDDHIYFSDKYLLFHPQAKGKQIMKKFNKMPALSEVEGSF